MTHPVYIIGFGASTPLGRDAVSSAAAVRAGVTGFTEYPGMLDSVGQPVRVALAPWLDVELQGKERFEALLYPAIEQALAAMDAASSGALRVALALGLPGPRRGLPTLLARDLRQGLARTFADRFSAVAMFEIGHAGGLLGAEAALAKMRAGAFDACVVAGVESYIAPASLNWLEEKGQLHGAGPLNNAWGFIPGEASAAALLVRETALAHLRVQPLARVFSVGTAVESNCINTETVCIGQGLTEAFRNALVALPTDTKVTDVFCDINGEPYRSDEFGFACLRMGDAFESASDFVAPADCWGDVSAASGVLFMMLSTVAGAKGYANGSWSLLWAGSENGQRAAMLCQLDRGA